MTIETFENDVQPILEEIEEISSVTLDDYNSEELVLFMETEDRANLKKLTPAIKRVLKENGFSENLISDWISPSPKDRWGDRESDSYELDLLYAYADIPKKEISEDAPDVLVFAKDYPSIIDASGELKDVFLSTFEKSNSQDEHFRMLKKTFSDYSIEPLYIYKHSGEHFEASPSCQWDSSLTGAIAIKKDAQEYSLDGVISDLNKWLSGDNTLNYETSIESVLPLEEGEEIETPTSSRSL